MNGSSGLKYVLIALIAVLFAAPVWDILSGFWTASTILGTEGGVQKSYPIAHFVTYTFTLVVLILLLFTPGKNIESPLHFFSQAFSQKVHLFLNYNDSSLSKEGYQAKGHILSSALMDGIFLVVMVAVYYYLIKKMNLIEGSYMYMIIFLFFVNFIIGVNTYFTRLISRADLMLSGQGGSQSGNESSYLNQKIMLAIGLMILTILLMTGGDAFSVWLSDIIAGWDFPILNWFTSPISRSAPVA